MKITKSQLKQIIKKECDNVLSEQPAGGGSQTYKKGYQGSPAATLEDLDAMAKGWGYTNVTELIRAIVSSTGTIRGKHEALLGRVAKLEQRGTYGEKWRKEAAVKKKTAAVKCADGTAPGRGGCPEDLLPDPEEP
jgi:hypothetical protein